LLIAFDALALWRRPHVEWPAWEFGSHLSHAVLDAKWVDTVGLRWSWGTKSGAVAETLALGDLAGEVDGAGKL